MTEFMTQFPGLTTLAKVADFAASWILGTIELLFWIFFLPVLIIIWCFYHPALAKTYFANALPLLWDGNWATRALLGLFVLLLLLIPQTTHKFAAISLKLLCVAGFIAYIIAIF